MSAEDHNEPFSRARRLRSCGKRVSRRDSSIAGKSISTVRASNRRQDREGDAAAGRVNLVVIQNETQVRRLLQEIREKKIGGEECSQVQARWILQRTKLRMR